LWEIILNFVAFLENLNFIMGINWDISCFSDIYLAFLENLIFTGAVTNEVEVDPLNPHYLTSAQYLGKDHIVVGGTDRSIIKIIDKVIKVFSGWKKKLPAGH
jgi:hypothetical protein